MDGEMTPREHTILLVSDDVALRDMARHELETIDERRRVSSVSTVDAARRIVEDAAPAVILLTEAAVTLEAGDLQERARRLDVGFLACDVRPRGGDRRRGAPDRTLRP